MICKPCCEQRHSECASLNCPCHHRALDDGGRPVKVIPDRERAALPAPVPVTTITVYPAKPEQLPILDGPRYLREGLPR